MNAPTSPLTRSIARQYDLFQSSLETVNRPRKFLNYGYTVGRKRPYEEVQQQLCLEVFDAAGIGPGHVVVDVGFGSGEQDFLLARTRSFARLIGFNISERQVRYADERARREGLEDRLSFRLGEAEVLPGVEPGSVDRVLAIECAFYFDRPRFYARAAEVLRAGGLLVVADITFADRAAFLTRRDAGSRRIGTRSSNRSEWERHFRTGSLRAIGRFVRPGAQRTVFEICKTAPFADFSADERRAWMRMAVSSQIVALGLALGFIHYDLIVLEKR
jgi:cyclopropane fatty-acyl-phospholipid synthase-like methyltransferase